MLCPNCHAEYTKKDAYCPRCGEDLPNNSTSIISLQKNLPAVLYNPQLPKGVAAGVGAVALGVGIELLRRNLLTRLAPPAARSVESALPTLVGMKDILFPQPAKPAKRSKKGFEVEETVFYMRRVTRH
jgi:predicted amidophosphoribosyltransferase